MRARLNVTEAERLCYSQRKLRAISALRNAGLSIQTIREGKQKLPDRRGRWYLLTSDTGSLLLFASLQHLIAYAEDVRLYHTTMLLLEADERINYERWRTDGTAYALALLVPQLRAIAHHAPKALRTMTPTNSVDTRSMCSEPDCPYHATGLLEGKPYCAGHAFVYSTLANLQAGFMLFSF
ncbi:MAG TPA: hypothetical protein VFU32_12460 [Ktedonobacterales bacterium]|nr:hypothetical protein [Ktedonobacterales bacterium]